MGPWNRAVRHQTSLHDVPFCKFQAALCLPSLPTRLFEGVAQHPPRGQSSPASQPRPVEIRAHNGCCKSERQDAIAKHELQAGSAGLLGTTRSSANDDMCILTIPFMQDDSHVVCSVGSPKPDSATLLSQVT